MTLADKLSLFSMADAIAVGLLFAVWLLCDLVIENAPASRPSVTMIVKDYRRRWMREMVTREPRIFDSGLIDSFRVGATFFASACMIAIGGGLAVLGNPMSLVGVAREIGATQGPVFIWQVKVSLVLFFLTNALLKFIWSHRLFGYCAIVMAAVPNDVNDPEVYARAEKAADININAARAYERALRSAYFGLGALGWLLGPVALGVAAIGTALVILRREFASQSRQVLLRSVGP